MVRFPHTRIVVPAECVAQLSMSVWYGCMDARDETSDKDICEWILMALFGLECLLLSTLRVMGIQEGQ